MYIHTVTCMMHACRQAGILVRLVVFTSCMYTTCMYIHMWQGPLCMIWRVSLCIVFRVWYRWYGISWVCGRSPHPSFWLIRVVALVVLSDTLPHTDDTLQAVPLAGNIGLPFLATRAESICLCALLVAKCLRVIGLSQSRPFAPPMSCALGTAHIGKSRSERKNSAATLVFLW